MGDLLTLTVPPAVVKRRQVSRRRWLGRELMPLLWIGPTSGLIASQRSRW